MRDHSSIFSRAVHEHSIDGKGNSDDEEGGAEGAGFVLDDEVEGVEDEQQQVSCQHKQE